MLTRGSNVRRGFSPRKESRVTKSIARGPRASSILQGPPCTQRTTRRLDWRTPFQKTGTNNLAVQHPPTKLHPTLAFDTVCRSRRDNLSSINSSGNPPVAPPASAFFTKSPESPTRFPSFLGSLSFATNFLNRVSKDNKILSKIYSVQDVSEGNSTWEKKNK